MRTTLRAVCGTACLATMAGCGSRSPAVDVPVSLLPPAAIDDHVVIMDNGRSEARLLDVSGAAPPPAPSVVPIVKNATVAEVRKGAGHTGELLVLCSGQADVKGVAPERPGLVRILSDGTTTTYRYDPPFHRMVQSDDGRYVFLFAPDSGDNSTFQNPNEVAKIDLEQKDGKPELKTLRSLGETPQDVKFSPGPMTQIAGVDKNLAVILMNRDIAVVDLANFDRPEFTIPLTKASAEAVTAAQVLFSANEKPPRIYLRADGSDDVFALSLETAVSAASGTDGGAPAGSADGGAAADNDFSLNFSQLGAGTGARPSDIAFFQDGDKTRLLVAAPGIGLGAAVVIDADSGRTTTVSLPMAATQILLYNGPKPSDSTPAERALLYAPGQSTVTFLDLAALGTEANRGGNAELLNTPQAYAKLAPLGDSATVSRAMLLHQGTGLSILNLDDRSLSPISGPNLVDAVADLDTGASCTAGPCGKLWLTPPGDRLGFLTLPDALTNEVRLDAPIDHFVRVPQSSAAARDRERPKVVVTHKSPLGYLTVLDAGSPANLDQAYSISGYVFEGVLGGGK